MIASYSLLIEKTPEVTVPVVIERGSSLVGMTRTQMVSAFREIGVPEP